MPNVVEVSVVRHGWSGGLRAWLAFTYGDSSYFNFLKKFGSIARCSQKEGIDILIYIRTDTLGVQLDEQRTRKSRLYWIKLSQVHYPNSLILPKAKPPQFWGARWPLTATSLAVNQRHSITKRALGRLAQVLRIRATPSIEKGKVWSALLESSRKHGWHFGEWLDVSSIFRNTSPDLHWSRAFPGQLLLAWYLFEWMWDIDDRELASNWLV